MIFINNDILAKKIFIEKDILPKISEMIKTKN